MEAGKATSTDVSQRGVEPVIVMWALAREIRTLAMLAETVATGLSLSAAMGKARVWKNRQGIVRACIGRHPATDFFRLLKKTRDADAAAKGQKRADPWQLATQIVLELSSSGRAAA